MPLPSFHMIDGAPQPVATFSHASEVDGWVFLTGQMPTWPDDPDRPLPEGIEAQTRRVMDNLIIVLEGMGLTLQNVAQARVYITDFERDYAAMNQTYKSYFEEGKKDQETPSYQIGFRLYSNGVSRDLTIDYDDFSMRGALKEIEFLKESDCKP